LFKTLLPAKSTASHSTAVSLDAAVAAGVDALGTDTRVDLRQETVNPQNMIAMSPINFVRDMLFQL
jgi:hypothetical protein